jgi:hypothetical protein
MSYNRGFSARLNYDPCAYNKRLTESTGPYAYSVYDGKYENCSRCTLGGYPRPFAPDFVQVESELYNITRPSSKCPSRKYHPGCKKSKYCISTYDKTAPVVLAPEVCPPVHNNLEWKGGNGIINPRPSNCGMRR